MKEVTEQQLQLMKMPWSPKTGLTCRGDSKNEFYYPVFLDGARGRWIAVMHATVMRKVPVFPVCDASPFLVLSRLLPVSLYARHL